MSDSSLLAFANMKPAVVDPYLGQPQRPSMNAAGPMDTANKFAMATEQLAQAKQVNDYNAKADPLKLQDLQAEVNSRMNAASDSSKYDAWAKTQATDKSLQQALSLNDDQAWQSAANALEKTQMITPEKAAEIRALPPEQRATYAAEVAATARATSDYMTVYGGKGAGAADALTPKQIFDMETEAHKQAMDEYKDNSSVNVDDRTQQIFAQMKGDAQKALGGGAAGSIANDKKKADSLLSPNAPPQEAPGGKTAIGSEFAKPAGQTSSLAALGGPAAPAAADQPAAKPEGSVAKDQQAHAAAIADQTKWVKATYGDGTPVERAASFTGDPQDKEAFKRWFNTLAMNTPFVSPADGKAHQKHSNFPE